MSKTEWKEIGEGSYLVATSLRGQNDFRDKDMKDMPAAAAIWFSRRIFCIFIFYAFLFLAALAAQYLPLSVRQSEVIF